jgi:hypothetical protein
VGLFSHEGLEACEAFSRVGRLRIVAVAVVANRLIGWVGEVFIG